MEVAMITVIDSPCGFGKTQYMINMINENPTKNYIYITPYLNEVERIKNNTRFLQDKITRFVEPVYTKKKKKYDCLVDYIYDSKNSFKLLDVCNQSNHLLTSSVLAISFNRFAISISDRHLIR